MKIEELKIGDWVYTNDSNYNKPILCTINAFDKNKVLTGLVWSEIHKVSPIGITEEILEKNGWKEDDEIYSIDYTYGILNAEIFQWGKEMVCMISLQNNNDVCSLCQIRYVHELQHILWALGMNSDLKL